MYDKKKIRDATLMTLGTLVLLSLFFTVESKYVYFKCSVKFNVSDILSHFVLGFSLFSIDSSIRDKF